MSDIARSSADLPIVVIGATTAGVPTTPVGSDTNGNLLVRDAASGADGSTSPTLTLQIGGKDVNGNLQTFNTDISGDLFVSTKTVRTYGTPATASVNNSSTLILAANANRKGLFLSNTSPQQISLGFDGQAAAYQYGITLYPGDKFWMDEYSFSTGAIYAITNGATTYIGVQEIT